MAKVTLELPPRLANQLQQFSQPELIDFLEQAFSNREKIELNVLSPASLPRKDFKISREAWYQRLLEISAWDEGTLRGIEEARE